MKDKFENWINHLDSLNLGIIFIIFGVLFYYFSSIIHKKYKKEGYRPFGEFKKEGYTPSRKNFIIIMYIRSLGGKIFGIGFTIFGIYKIIEYFQS